ncbi:MAG: 2-C-methyl-D-erythritol 2,4-cyclodiphosphate synthase [Gammaproteobacteria bacterium]|nr:MAG: 2-C-methyl-D-erythritol 2,4-cyclodiphosphate synthase [Gammaproteobacteria bacterium]
MRIGQGIDAHRFGEGSSIRLGGVDIPFERGIEAHSDGDVVLHAICDAMLGAASLGDLGKHFPSDDDRWHNADSVQMLEHVFGLVSAQNLRVSNLDVTVICQAPRLSTHVEAMQAVIAATLEMEKNHVSVKATTTDGLGYTGRGEGIAAHAVVLLSDRG